MSSHVSRGPLSRDTNLGPLSFCVARRVFALSDWCFRDIVLSENSNFVYNFGPPDHYSSYPCLLPRGRVFARFLPRSRNPHSPTIPDSTQAVPAITKPPSLNIHCHPPAPPSLMASTLSTRPVTIKRGNMDKLRSRLRIQLSDPSHTRPEQEPAESSNSTPTQVGYLTCLVRTLLTIRFYGNRQSKKKKRTFLRQLQLYSPS
ncbi:hypothetical protein CALVIDRAFT_333711 [Calocera viscosa TUFC12733]|uniref:Uncharacterized protein n=1 Tax=Calocera viscosa (strain TUFC12733) TaxID=1330018 RepID=A0A167HLP6_CALVF|nr:hypothetical protein CALVIDRAFT_333711 [Calocera viscosa TUFC12733]